MDNQESATLWDGQTDVDDRPLRRPRAHQQPPEPKPLPPLTTIIDDLENLKLNSGTESDSQEPLLIPVQTETLQNNIISTSKLSVNAREFYPRDFVQPTSIQNRLNRRKVNETDQNVHQQHSNDLELSYVHDAAINITRLKEIVNAVTYDPGKFERLLDAFMEIVAPHFEEVSTVDALADMIYDQAITEASFRYNAARLCNILQDQCALFGPRLYILCEKGVQSEANILGATYFLAELYTQLHSQSMYGVCFLEALKKLIASKHPDGFKCICQSLKLCGHYLDVDHKPHVDNIFSLLEGELNGMQGNMKNLFKSVIELRVNNWGHSNTQPSSTATNGYQEMNGFLSSNQENDIFTNEADISLEEHEFLANCEEYNDYLSGNFDPDELCDPEPEMDEEIQAAFREFVQLSKR